MVSSMLLTPDEIRAKYHKSISDYYQEERLTYFCSECKTFFLYYEQDAPKNCSLCNGILKRDIFPYYVNEDFFENQSITKCCECGTLTDRKILGVFICENCYDYDFSKNVKSGDDLNFIIEHILECGVEYNPELIICRGCKSHNLAPCRYLKYCAEHYVLLDNQEVLDIEID